MWEKEVKEVTCVTALPWTCLCGYLRCREAMMTRSLRRLREQIVRANLLAQEAGFIAEELNKRTEYLVTLQIPAANLDANRKVRLLCVCACVAPFIALHLRRN